MTPCGVTLLSRGWRQLASAAAIWLLTSPTQPGWGCFQFSATTAYSCCWGKYLRSKNLILFRKYFCNKRLNITGRNLEFPIVSHLPELAWITKEICCVHFLHLSSNRQSNRWLHFLQSSSCPDGLRQSCMPHTPHAVHVSFKPVRVQRKNILDCSDVIGDVIGYFWWWWGEVWVRRNLAEVKSWSDVHYTYIVVYT